MSAHPFRPFDERDPRLAIAGAMLNADIDYDNGDALEVAYARAARVIYRLRPHGRFEYGLDVCLFAALWGAREYLRNLVDDGSVFLGGDADWEKSDGLGPSGTV